MKSVLRPLPFAWSERTKDPRFDGRYPKPKHNTLTRRYAISLEDLHERGHGFDGQRPIPFKSGPAFGGDNSDSILATHFVRKDIEEDLDLAVFLTQIYNRCLEAVEKNEKTFSATDYLWEKFAGRFGIPVDFFNTEKGGARKTIVLDGKEYDLDGGDEGDDPEYDLEVQGKSLAELLEDVSDSESEEEVRSRIPFRGRSHFSLATGWVVGP